MRLPCSAGGSAELRGAHGQQELLVMMGGLTGTAAQQCDGKKGAESSATYSLPARETLERWGQRRGGQGSVKDDSEHGAIAGG